MKTQIITDRAQLTGLSDEWNELLRDSAADAIFLTWEWISTWLEVVRPEAKLLVVAVRDDSGRLAAIAPFYRTRLRLLRVLPFRGLRVLGDVDSGAEYPDLIIRRGLEEQVMPLLAAALRAQRRMWDVLWLPLMAGWTGAAARFAHLAEAVGDCPMHERESDFAALELPATSEAYFAALSSNARSAIRRQSKKLMAGGESVEISGCRTPAELRTALDALFDLHRQRWEAAGESGSFVRRPRMAAFYRRFAALALQRGWLRVFTLATCGQVRAVQYGYAYGGVFHQLQEGYDPAAPDGVGNVLRDAVFRACIAEGLRGYDFLGEFTEHKARWNAQRRTGLDVMVGRPSLKNRLLFTRPVWPTGRYLREVMPAAATEADAATSAADASQGERSVRGGEAVAAVVPARVSANLACVRGNDL